jgi:hypothetical protein
MKTFSKLLSEVAQPNAEDEIHFKAKHAVEKMPHSHAGDEVFKGSTKKAPKRVADYEEGNDEKVYEAMDPVGKEDDDIDNDGDVDSSDKYLHRRRKAISKAMKKEQAELQEKAVSQAQAIAARIALKHKKEGTKPEPGTASADMAKMSEKDLEDFTKAKKDAPYKVEETDLEEVSKDLLGRYAAKAHNRGDMAARMSSSGRNKEVAHIANKRYSGVKNAINKLSGRARVNATEEVNQLDELSPNTLHSYTKKAAGNMAGNAAVAAAQASSSMKKSSPDVKRKIKNRMKGITSASGRLADKANMAEDAWEEIPMMSRQLQFIMYAAEEIMSYLNDCDNMCVDPEEWFQNKLAHVHGQMMTLHGYVEGDRRMNMGMYGEEVELDEVSDKMLDRYRQKAFADQPAGDDGSDKYRKRKFGRDLAFAKQTGRAKVLATKESLEEAVSAGKLKLDDGSSITVSKQDANLLNQMFKDLNPKNRKMMQDTMMTDKAGFDEIVGFAREAL